MISFTDSEVRGKIVQLNEYLSGALEKDAKRVKGNLSSNTYDYKNIGARDLVVYVINQAWDDFFSKFNEDNTRGVELDKLTEFNRKELIGNNSPLSKEYYLEDNKRFLDSLIKILYEMDFYSPDVNSTRSYLKDDILDVLVEYDSEGFYGYKWVRDRMAVSITRFILNSDGAKKLMGTMADISVRENVFSASVDAAVERGEKDILAVVEGVKKSAEELLNATKKSIEIEFDAVKRDISLELFNEKLNFAEFKNNIENLVEKIKSSKVGIEGIKRRLEGYHSEYNFVGLYDGFKKLKNDKDKELDSINEYYHIAMVVAIILPLVTIGSHILYPDLVKGKGWIEWLSWGGPFAAVEALILYYARVMYSEIKSIKTQLVQINLRGSLCQFIEEYMNYRQRIKGDADEINDSALEKFDSVIFSAIQMESDNIPGAFDGVNAIAELAGKILAKGK